MTKPHWHGHGEQSPWPTTGALQKGLREIGLFVDGIQVEQLGGRTLGLSATQDSRPVMFCLVRQRYPDPRMVCPLAEEHQALQALSAVQPGLVPRPLGMIRTGNTDALLALSWVAGQRLGSPDKLKCQGGRIAEVLAAALADFHGMGWHLDLGLFTRRVHVERLLRQAKQSPLRGSLVHPAQWDRALSTATSRAKHLGPPTLLHGDPHAYNLIETTQGVCWLDFEQLCVGPPEWDHARAWVLLHAQVQGEVETPWDSDGQLACRFLAAAGFLEACSAWEARARSAVETAFRAVVCALQ